MDPSTILEIAVAFGTLLLLEVVLGIDNIVVIAVVTARLPEESAKRARRVGLFLAMVMRIVLLLGIFLLQQLEAELFTIFGNAFSGSDLVMLVGGGFLIAKATKELHDKVEGGGHTGKAAKALSFGAAIGQILAFDLVFSVDSVLTAVGMTDIVWVMIAAIVIAVIIMLIFAEAVSGFIERHPTSKVLALAFMLLIGVLLVADGFGEHIPRGYVYFALAFSLMVELINIRIRAKQRGRPAEAANTDGVEPF